jgi:hypothetical protein
MDPIEALDVDPSQFEGSQTIPMLMETATIRERSKPGMEGQHFDRVPSRLMVCKAVHRIEPTIQFADDAFGHVTGSGQSGMQKMRCRSRLVLL